MPTIASVATPQPRGGSQNSAPSVSGISTAAVRMRALSMLSSVRGELLAGAAVTPLAALIRRDGLVQRRCVEVRPEQIGEIELRVRDLPKQEVGNALLA